MNYLEAHALKEGDRFTTPKGRLVEVVYVRYAMPEGIRVTTNSCDSYRDIEVWNVNHLCQEDVRLDKGYVEAQQAMQRRKGAWT